MSTEAAFDFADQVTLDTHFPYGAGELPPFARGSKPAKAGRAFYTFRSYAHHLMSLYKHLGKERQGASLARAFMWLLAFGGRCQRRPKADPGKAFGIGPPGR